MIYSIDEIAEIITPVMRQYSVNAAWLFGSYARGDAKDSSDIDILVDTRESSLKSLGDLALFFDDLSQALGKAIDVVTLDSMQNPTNRRSQLRFRESVNQEKVELYAAA